MSKYTTVFDDANELSETIGNNMENNFLDGVGVVMKGTRKHLLVDQVCYLSKVCFKKGSEKVLDDISDILSYSKNVTESLRKYIDEQRESLEPCKIIKMSPDQNN